MIEQTLSHRGPITIRLWFKFSMMCPCKKVSCGRGMVQEDTDLCACPVDGLTMKGGIFMLRSQQGDSVEI